MCNQGVDHHIIESIETIHNENFSQFLEALMRLYGKGRGKNEKFIWGDKTPNNLVHMPLLHGCFPNAKFIHIIRDPRARALSAKNAWGANMLYSAERWNLSITKARDQGLRLGSNYLEVFYEKLVQQPNEIIEEICKFLDIPFDETMLHLDKPVENRGAKTSETRTSNIIVSEHVEKFRDELSPDEIRRIEEVAYPEAKKLGYISEDQDISYIPLDGIERWRSIIEDRINTFIGHVKYWGMFRTIRFLIWHARVDLPTN
jgi:hypothetical protein